VKVHPAAFAVAADGSIIINVAGYCEAEPPEKLLQRALDDGGTLFVGVRLHAFEVRELLGRLQDNTFEACGFILGARNRRRRKRAARAIGNKAGR
jgi:hypothetical protein